MPITGVQSTPLLQMKAEKAYARKESADETRQAQIVRDSMDKVTISEEARQKVLEAANKAGKKIVANPEN